MSDEQEHRRDPAPGGFEPDETRRFTPFDDDDSTKAAENPPDEGPRSSDAYVFDRNGHTTRPDDDENVLTPRPDSTAVMPAADRDAPEERNGAWSGRAEVPPPRPGREEYTRTEWGPEPPAEPRRR